MRGVWTLPLGKNRVAYQKSGQPAEVMFGQLVSKSTNHVWHIDYLVAGAGLG